MCPTPSPSKTAAASRTIVSHWLNTTSLCPPSCNSSGTSSANSSSFGDTCVCRSNRKVLSHTGFNMRISLTVTEAEDTKVRASVDGTLVTEAEPPWLARRQAGVRLSPDIDAAERARFHRELLEAVEAHLARYIPGSSTPGG